MLTVACVEVGDYLGRGKDYVARLHRGVSRHLSIPHRFVCLTDRAEGLPDGVEGIPAPEGVKGWYAKLALFQPGLFTGRVLYLDLDTVIVGSLDDVAAYSGQFALLSNFYHPERFGGSGVMAWPAEFASDIWRSYLDAGCPTDLYDGDQEFIGTVLTKRGVVPDKWQSMFPGAFLSYKVHIRSDHHHQREVGNGSVPPGAKVVCFHGQPRMHEVAWAWPDYEVRV